MMDLSVELDAARPLRAPAVGHRRSRPSDPATRGRARSGKQVSRILWSAFTCTLLGALAWGWINRNERHWIPETGAGYWLGVGGGAVMLALLVYPLRKRFKSLRFIGTVPAWFRLHMAFGILGPTLILLHCNFKSESLNASVALTAMLVVAGSGLVGRFLYAHVHSNLSGQRRAATHYFDDAIVNREVQHSDALFVLSEGVLSRLSSVIRSALSPPQGLVAAIGHASMVRWQTRQLSRSLNRDIRARNEELLRHGAAPRNQIRKARRAFEADVAGLLAAVRSAAGLAIYERLFSLWHFLHFPLFLMFVFAAIAHVVAVHLY